MDASQELDNLLKFLSEQERGYLLDERISNDKLGHIGTHRKRMLFRRLVRDGYAKESETIMFGEPALHFSISFDGEMALQSKVKAWADHPYRKKAHIELTNTIWTTLKIIAVIAHAFIIIFISIWAVKVSDKSSKLENELTEKSETIETLKSEISVLKANTTSGEKEKTTANISHKKQGE